MRTEDLISRLVAEPPRPPLRALAMALAMLVALALPLGWFLGSMGMRPDLEAALLAPVTAAKSLLPFVLSATSFALALHLARPEARVGRRLVPAALVALAALGLWLGFWVQTPPPALGAAIRGSTQVKCLTTITLMSLPPLAVGLLMLRRGASSAPALSGAVLGLACGGMAAAGYALHCTEDNPLFYVTWYGTAILAAGGIGALLGWRLLRW